MAGIIDPLIRFFFADAIRGTFIDQLPALKQWTSPNSFTFTP